jgi:hypothetical protein
MTPPIRPDTAGIEVFKPQKTPTATARNITCQLTNHIPALIGPNLVIVMGAAHVAEISDITDTARVMPTHVEVYPASRRNVVIWPPKLRTVKYSIEAEKDGKKVG